MCDSKRRTGKEIPGNTTVHKAFYTTQRLGLSVVGVEGNEGLRKNEPCDVDYL